MTAVAVALVFTLPWRRAHPMAVLVAAFGTLAVIDGAAFVLGAEPNSELIGVAVAIVVLLIAFGSVVAMGLPIYALFIVTRHRQHLHEGMSVENSAGMANATTGQAASSRSQRTPEDPFDLNASSMEMARDFWRSAATLLTDPHIAFEIWNEPTLGEKGEDGIPRWTQLVPFWTSSSTSSDVPDRRRW